MRLAALIAAAGLFCGTPAFATSDTGKTLYEPNGNGANHRIRNQRCFFITVQRYDHVPVERQS
jgi:hypothetical protein